MPISAIESFRLIVFRTVAERLSFTQAAEILHLSQPSVTSHIKALEEELGVRLFERSSTGTSLTAAGERLQSFAREVARLSQQTLRAIGSLNGEQLGPLRLGASTTIAQYLLPRVLARFVELHPKVGLSIVSANTAEIVELMLARRIDLGLIEGPPGTTDLKTEHFVGDEIVVIVGREHRFAAEDAQPVPLAALAQEPLLFRELGSGTRRVVEDALRKAGLEPRTMRIVMELDSTEAIKSGAEAGLGVGFVSLGALRHSAATNLRIVPVQGLKIERYFLFLYPHGPDLMGAAGAFLRVARQFQQPYGDSGH
jgi:LysR family transcriptional regulator, transcriptional activator of the cysJI operon